MPFPYMKFPWVTCGNSANVADEKKRHSPRTIKNGELVSFWVPRFMALILKSGAPPKNTSPPQNSGIENGYHMFMIF